MADDVEMTPIAPEEGGAVPPKVAPFAAPGASAAPAAAAPAPTGSTIKLKPVIRKPMIHKPTIGGAKPPVAVPPPAPAAAKKATQNLKSVTGPIPAQATLKKTGIIAEGIITPQQQQAAKSKTSRISLESAMGVAPVAKEGPAPLRTIRLRRPTDLKPAGPTPLTPQEPAAPVAPKPEPAPIEAPAAQTVPTITPEAPAEDASVTQKRTLKLHRPGGVGIKRPTLGVGAAPAAEGGGDETAQTVAGNIPELAPLSPFDLGDNAAAADESAGVPSWVAVFSLITSLAALLAIALVMYFLWTEGVGPSAGANEMQFLQM